jgi:hypothetical protein
MKAAKAVAGAVGLLATALTAALADDVFSFDEWGTVLSTALAGAASVYAIWRVPNAPA